MIEKIYSLLTNMYKDDFKFLGTDTDSIICVIKNLTATQVYNKIGENISEFDGESFNGVVDTIPLINRKKNKLLGDEINGKIALNYLWLRPKSYSVGIAKKNSIEIEQKIAVKGIPRKISYNFSLEDFRNVLKHQNSISVEIIRFERENLNVYTIRQHKKALTTTFKGDSKRHFISTTESLAYGHFKIKDVIPSPWEDENNDNESLTLTQKLNLFKHKFIIIKNY